MADGDDAARRAKRTRDAEGARLRRAARRRDRESAWKATAAMEGSVAVVPPPSAMLQSHLVRLNTFLVRLEGDEGTSLAERTRIFVGAVGAFAKAAESHEFRARLDDIERRIAGRPRGLVAV